MAERYGTGGEDLSGLIAKYQQQVAVRRELQQATQQVTAATEQLASVTEAQQATEGRSVSLATELATARRNVAGATNQQAAAEVRARGAATATTEAYGAQLGIMRQLTRATVSEADARLMYARATAGMGPAGGRGGGALPPTAFGRQPLPPSRQLGPGLTAAPPLGAYYGGVASDRAAQAEKQFQGTLRESNAALAARGVASQRAQVLVTQLSNAEMRHGALSSEWITAAARGETTLRSLGNQVGVTAAKFGGWVVAGAAVYGVFDALKNLYEGATQSNNAVANLSRFIETGFNADKAKQQMRDLAYETNTSIGEVGEAASQFAKVFHNQDQAMESARAALILHKLDNLSLADSYKSLTAAVQGFHLQAKDIPSLMDQINAVQREFGANVSQVVQGFGRAAGSYNVAGGSPEYLKALISTIVRSTGQSGTAAGTAVARSATRFIQQPANQAVLTSLAGVTNFDNYDRVIDQVFKAIHDRHLNKHDINRLAQALAGPQLGSRAFTALLENQDLFKGILTETGPGKVGGTAKSELEKRLRATGEQVHRVKVEMENLGSALEQAGAAAPFRTLLSVLQAIFGATRGIVQGFNSLPAPIQTAAEVLTGMVVGIAALRKISSPEGRLANIIPGLSGGAGGRFARATLRGGVQQATEDYFGAATGARSAEKAALTATAQRDAYLAENAALLAKTAGTEEEQVVATERMAQLTAAMNAAVARANTAQSALNFEYANLVAKQELMAGLPRGAAAQRAYLAKNDLYALTGAPGTKNQVTGPEGQLYPATPVGRARQAFEEGEAGRAAQTAEAEVAAKANVFSRGLGAARTGAEAAAGRLAALGQMDMAAALGGPIGIAVTALFLLPPAISEFVNIVHHLTRRWERDGAPPATAAQQREVIRRGIEVQRQQAQGNVPRPFSRQSPFLNIGIPGNTWADRFAGEDRRAVQDADTEQRNLQTQMRELGLRRAGRYRGPIVGQVTSQIRAEAGGYVKAYREHQITLDQAVGFLNDALKDVTASSSSPAKKALAKTDINTLIQRLTSEHKGQKQSLEKAFEAMDPKNFQQTLQDDAAFIQEIGGRPAQWRDLQAAYTAATRLAKRNPGDKNNIKRLQAVHQAIQTAQQAILSDLQDAFSAGSGAADDDRAIQRAISQANKMPAGKPRRQAVAAVVKAAGQEITQTLQDSFAISQSTGDDQRAIDRAMASARRLPPGRNRRLVINQITQSAEQQIDSALTDNLALGQSESARSRAFDHALAELRRLPPSRHRNAQIQQVLDKRYQDQINEIQATATLREGNSSSAGQADAIEIGAIDQQIAAARKEHQSDLVIKALLGQRQQAVQQQAQDAIALGDAYSSLAAAGIPSYDPVAQARAAASGAQTHLADVLGHKKGLGKGFQVEYINALTAVKNANQAVNEAIQRQTEETAQARFEYLESLTTNPIAIDKLKIRADTEALGAAHTQAEQYKARAQRNQDRQQLLADRISQREDDVQFALDMHKISAQQAIGELNDLLKVHNLSKTQRREIQRRIQSLRDQVSQEAQGFDLNVGSLKLPTIYDVRRAFDPIRHAITAERDRAMHVSGHGVGGDISRLQVRPTTTIHNTVTVNVNDKGSVHEVYDALDHVMGTHVRSSARSRGHRRVR